MKKILLMLVALFCFAASWAQQPVVSKAVAFAVSAPARDFGIAKPEPGKTTSRKFVGENEGINKSNEKLIKQIIPGLGGKTSSQFQRSVDNSTNLVSPPITSFDGNSSADNFAAYGGRLYPPDANGDVGPNHYVQTTNLLVGIYNKSTGALVVPKFKMSTLFASLGPPFSTTDSGDPIVLYDQLSDRWLISQFLFTNPSSGVYYQVIAISQTGDPTGAYYAYAFLMPNNKLNDYPHFGVWPDGYYMADNQFTNGSSFSGAGAFAFDRAKMLVGDPTASYIYFDQAFSCPTCGGQLPTDLEGFATPPIGTPNLFMEFRANEYGDPLDGLRIFAFHADFATPANSTFTQVGTDLPLAAFDARNPGGRGDIEQPAPSTTTSYLDGIADRLMHRLLYRILPGGAQSFVGNFTVNVSGVNPTSAATYQAGIKWFELRRSAGGVMSVNDEGIYAPGAGNGAAGRNIWMAGIAQDGEGNLGLGYSASSTTLHPSILYTGRLTSDPPGTMGQGENTLVAGSGVQLGTANRWGDYSSMSVDPVDECTFWYTQEYYSAASQASSTIGWLTRIGSFKVNPACVVTNRGTISGTVTNCITNAPIANAVVTTPDGFFTTTNAAGQYSILVASGTYTVVITVGGGFGSCTTINVSVPNGGNTVVNCCLAPSSIIVSAGAVITAESCSPPNAAIDPNETVTVDLSLSNTGGLNTTNLVATLQATGGVTNPSGPQNYGVVVGGGASVARPFTFTAANVSCGDLITATLQLQDGATNLGTVTYTFITGATSTAVATFSYTGPPVAIPDVNATGINIPITVSGAGTKVTDLNFRFDALTGCDATIGNINAALDHTFLSDLVFKLKSPAGTTVTFMQARGGGGNNICNLFFDDDGAFPAISTLPATGGVSGNYAPENPFSAFDGQTANGTWTLNVSDIAALDVGSVRGFSIVLTTSTPVCCVCTPPVITAPTVTQPTCTTPTGTIVVNATGNGTLEYSVDNGANYQASATFGGLVPGNYNIKVRLQASPSCESVYANNPVVIHATVLPIVGMSADGPLTFCAGGSVNLGAVVIYPNFLRMLLPYNIDFNIGTAVFGPSIITTPLTGDFVYIPDGTASYLGCNPYAPGSLNGKVALIDRGTCAFILKVKNAQDAGAIGVIIVNNNAGGLVNMGGADPTITIPSIFVSQSDGSILKNMIAQGTTNGNTLAHTYSYLWSNGATTASIPVTQSGTFTVQTTDENGCSGTSEPVTVTVNPIPNAVATPSSQNSCNGSAITTIVLSGNVTGINYDWIRDNTATVTGIAASGSGNISGSLTNTTAAPVTVTFTITPSYTNVGVTCTGTPITATVTVNQTTYFACPGNMTETITDVICFKAVNTPNPVFCGVLTRLTWKLTGATVLSSPTSGINYLGLRNMNVGTTTVTYTATFTGGIVRTCSFTVLVIETIPPAILCPPDKHVYTDLGKCYKTGPVSLGSPIVSDNCGIASVTNNAPAVYNIGVNFVTWTVTDKSGNTRTCVQRVTVNDIEKPTITCPANVIANTGPVCSATPVTLPAPVFNDNCGVVTLTWAMTGVTWGQSPYTGINFVPTMNYATGLSTIIYTAIDASGNAKTCTFTVTVRDVTPPTLICPPAQILCKVANNIYSIPLLIQSDNCVIASTIYSITGATSRTGTGTDASGIFNLGISTVKWTVKDVNGNTSTCSTTVTVVATSDPVCNAAPLVDPEIVVNTAVVVNPGVIIKKTEKEVPGLTITAWPNPTVNYFNLKVNSPVKETIEIRMYDMAGKLVQVISGVPGNSYKFGESAGSGMYIIEVSQGTNKQMVKLVKMN